MPSTFHQFDKLVEEKCAQARLLVVEDDDIMTALYTSVLGGIGQPVCIKTGREALREIEAKTFDLVILDYQLPDETGLSLCQSLRKTHSQHSLPVIMITASNDPAIEDKCWEVGCSDFVNKPFRAQTLRHRILSHLQLKFAFDLLHHQSVRDQLTGMFNRHYLESIITKQRQADSQSVCVLMVDIDHFKLYNDRYGHDKGDACLKTVAGIIMWSLRDPEQVGIRYGGEEFLILLPDTKLETGVLIAERIRSRIAQENIANKASPSGVLTVSVGVAVTPKINLDDAWHNLLGKADSRLYKAKHHGRNQVVWR